MSINGATKDVTSIMAMGISVGAAAGASKIALGHLKGMRPRKMRKKRCRR